MATSEIAKLESRWRENPQGLTFAPLAEAYRKLKDPARALEILRPGLERHPDYIPANIVLGRCHWDLNDLPAAERAFTHVLRLDGENVIALKALADISERLARYDEAERWLDSLLVVDRSNDEARAQLERVRTLQAEQGTGTRAADAGAGADAETESEPQVDHALGLEPTALDSGDEMPVEAMALEAMSVETTVASDAPGSDAADDLAMVEPMDLEPTAFEPTAFEATGFAGSAPAAESATPAESDPRAEEPAGFESFDSVSLADVSGAGVESMSDGFIAEEEFAPPPDETAESTSAPEAGAEAQPSADATDDDIGVERSEEIVLRASGAEFQTPSAAEDLMQTAGPQGDALQPEPHLDDHAPMVDASDEAPWGQDDGAADTFAAPVAEFTPEPAMEPAPESEPESHLAHPTPAVPRGQTGSDHPAEPEPDLVVTETMAEVYLRQGHVIEALAVYRELSRRSPNDLGLRNRIAELELRAAMERGGRRAYAASETGGQSVSAFMRSILAARPTAVGGPRWSQASGVSADSSVAGRSEPAAGVSTEAPVDAGAPTRPAGDPLSLGSVFGEEPPAATPAMPEPKPASGVSFDEFFGAPRPPSSGNARPNPAPSGKGDDDLDQFHTWLQGLKR